MTIKVDTGVIARLLTALSASPQEMVPLFADDMTLLDEVAHIKPVRVVHDKDGNPSIFYVHKQRAINSLKLVGNLMSTSEAEKEVIQAHREEHGSNSNV